MKKRRVISGWLVGMGCSVVAVLLAGYLVQQAQEQMETQELALLGEQVRRAAVSCYASEGRYPQELDYLIEHYGLVVDETRYNVMYDVFASNIIPDIAVSVRGENGQ